MPGSRGAASRWLLALLAVLLSAGCAVQNLAFVTDTRLSIISPKDRVLVHLPVTIRWRMREFTVAGPGSAPVSKNVGYFAIFVDRAPVRPGQSLRAVAASDQACMHTPGCPNASYLAERGVYTTTKDYLTLTQVAEVNTYQQVQLHTVTIVLLNTAGRRIGESAWYVDFRLKAALLG
ncbi:MAG: hypothetical protein ACYCO3_02135 [Mycobacteriales bacterium]